MPETYIYEIWNGKRIGLYYTRFPFQGNSVVIADHNYKPISIPLLNIVVQQGGPVTIIHTVLDVRRKSSRQIKRIIEVGANGNPSSIKEPY